jgi:cobalt/nickel transport system permease protein
LDAPTSLATGVVAVAAVGVALRKSRNELDERTAPMAGLVAAFVFAVQMLNFPVGVGTSGHLMGGALAAVLVGPWTAVLVLSVVLLVQALLFADGGLTALGTNITLIGLVTVLVGWAVTKLVLSVLPKRPTSVVPAAFIGALLSVPAAAAVFVGLYLVGGAVELPFGALLATMLGWHTLIGLGEAIITALTVGAVIAVRPDLVYAARGLQPALVLKDADGGVIGTTGPAEKPSRPIGGTVIAALIVSFLLAGVVSFFASSNPDGLEFVAEDQGFLESAKDSAVGEFIFADYGEVGGIPVGIAGILGVLVTLAIGWGIGKLVTRRRDADAPDAELEKV